MTKTSAGDAMKDTVDRLSAELTERYRHYVETFLVDLWSLDGNIEFRCGFALRSDHLLRSFTLDLPATIADKDVHGDLMITVIFEEIERQIDAAVAESRHITN